MADVSILNTTAGITAKTVDLLESDQTITGLKTFDRDPSAPFAVSASSAVVTNLDADKLDGSHGSTYLARTNHTGEIMHAQTSDGSDNSKLEILGGGDPGVAEHNTRGGHIVAYGNEHATRPGRVELCPGNVSGSQVLVYPRGASGTGDGRGIVQVLDKDVTAQTVASSAAETTVYTFSVPANTLGSDNILRLTLLGNHRNDAGGAFTLTIRVKFGGTTVLSHAQSITNATNYRQVILQTHIVAQNATNAQFVSGHLTIGDQLANATMGTANLITASGRYAGLAIDSTSAQTLEVTVQHSASSATLDFIMQGAVLELLETP